MGRRIDETKIIGEKYGRLTIIKSYREGKNIMCDCTCECGGHREHIRYSALKDGSTKSCGCLHSEITKEIMTKYNLKDIIGEKYGRLTIINAYRLTNKSIIYCDCICECGNIAERIQYSSLKNETTKSCGCLHDELSSKRLSLQRKKYNQYRMGDEYMIGETNDGAIFIFDEEDYDKIKNYCWYKNAYGYFVSYNPNSGRVVFLHRLIMDCPDEFEVDHIHHTTMDNRKKELRICKPHENALNKRTPSHNTSGHKNVQKSGNKWQVVIRQKYIGRYDTFEEACAIEEEVEKEMYGEYSVYSN